MKQTEALKRVLKQARLEAKSRESLYLGTEHILLALLHPKCNCYAKFFIDFTYKEFSNHVDNIEGETL